MKHIVNLQDIELQHHVHGDRFEARTGSIAREVGAKLLGYALHVVPPGKCAWPYHCHHVNEEMFLILEGTGVLRTGDGEAALRAGDVIAALPGGADTAHQIINTSDRELRYVAVSTRIPSEIVEYPDSGKVSVYVGSGPGADPAQRTFSFRGRLGPAAEYWDGE